MAFSMIDAVDDAFGVSCVCMSVIIVPFFPMFWNYKGQGGLAQMANALPMKHDTETECKLSQTKQTHRPCFIEDLSEARTYQNIWNSLISGTMKENSAFL
jgi:hypothetical protein